MSKNIGTLLNAATAYSERSQSSRLVRSWTEETASEYQKTTARLLSEVETLAAKQKTENANPNHSQTGLFNAVKKEVEAFVTGLRWLRDAKGVLETRCGNLYGQLFIASLPKSDRSEPVQGQRDVFIWSALQALPPEERRIRYLQASERDQTEILRAILDSPLPLVDDEVVLRGSDERAARLQPDRYRRFIETGELLNEVTCILRDCLDLGAAFGLDVPAVVDELGPKIRTALDFAIDHVGGRGKRVLVTSAKDAVAVAAD